MSIFEKTDPIEKSEKIIHFERYPSIEKSMDDLIRMNNKYLHKTETIPIAPQATKEISLEKLNKKSNKKKK